MAEVFISYARENAATARRLAAALKARGFDVWWDQQLPSHEAYGDVIEQKLQAVEQGWRPELPVWLNDLELDPAFALLKDLPLFQRARSQVLAHVARERAELGRLPANLQLIPGPAARPAVSSRN